MRSHQGQSWANPFQMRSALPMPFPQHPGERAVLLDVVVGLADREDDVLPPERVEPRRVLLVRR